jgi:hypothetical protein
LFKDDERGLILFDFLDEDDKSGLILIDWLPDNDDSVWILVAFCLRWWISWWRNRIKICWFKDDKNGEIPNYFQKLKRTGKEFVNDKNDKNLSKSFEILKLSQLWIDPLLVL